MLDTEERGLLPAASSQAHNLAKDSCNEKQLSSRSNEATRLRREVRDAAGSEAFEIITAARREIRRLIVTARRELQGLEAQITAIDGGSNDSGVAPSGAEAPTRTRNRLASQRHELRRTLGEARADLHELREQARTLRFTPLSSSEEGEKRDVGAPDSCEGIPAFQSESPAVARSHTRPRAQPFERARAAVRAFSIAANKAVRDESRNETRISHRALTTSSVALALVSFAVVLVVLARPHSTPQRAEGTGITAATSSPVADTAGPVSPLPESDANPELTTAARQWLDAYYRNDKRTLGSLEASGAKVSDERSPDERLPPGLQAQRSLERPTFHFAGVGASFTARISEQAAVGGRLVSHKSWISQVWIREMGGWRVMDTRLLGDSKLK